MRSIVDPVPEHVVLVRNCMWGDCIKKDEVKFQVFWDVTACHWVSECGRLKGSYCLRIQGQVVRVPLDHEDEGITVF